VHCKSAKKIVIFSKSEKKKSRIGNPMLCIDSSDVCIFIAKCKTKTEKYKSDFMNWLFDLNLLNPKNIVLESRHEIEFFEKLQHRIDLYNETFSDIYNMQSYIPITKEKEYKINPLYNVKLELQKSVCNGKYRLDCYIERYNLIIEFDEEQHKYTVEADKTRIDKIKEWFIENNNADLRVIRVDKNNPDYYIELIMGYMSIPI